MQLKYIISFALITATAFYIYQDKALQSEILGNIYHVAPELNQSTLFKWKNAKGEWQITDKAPRKGVAFTIVTSNDQVNVMPSPPSKKKK